MIVELELVQVVAERFSGDLRPSDFGVRSHLSVKLLGDGESYVRHLILLTSQLIQHLP